MTYNKALDIMETAVARGYSRERLESIWERLTRAARARRDRIEYTYCPVCETYLDWAWCSTCKMNR